MIVTREFLKTTNADKISIINVRIVCTLDLNIHKTSLNNSSRSINTHKLPDRIKI